MDDVQLLTYLVEVDVHALELELRSAVVTMRLSVPSRKRGQDQWAGNRRCIHAIAVEAVLARDGLPKSRGQQRCFEVVSSRVERRGGGLGARAGTHQKAAPIWLPWETCQLQVAMIRSAGVDRSNLRIGRSEGEPRGEEKFTLAI